MSNKETFPRAQLSLEALNRLKEGNARFGSGLRSIDTLASPRRIKELAENGQKPFSVVLACSDSRVPAETIFDCGLGDLFVIRVAGNVISPDVIASIEFAAAKFSTPLCMVMGHTLCGAVEAAVATERGQPPVNASPNLHKLIDQIRPSAELALRAADADGTLDIAHRTAVENVHRGMRLITEQSPALRSLIKEHKFMIAGALYNLAEGRVDFFDEAKRETRADSEPFVEMRRVWPGGH